MEAPTYLPTYTTDPPPHHPRKLAAAHSASADQVANFPSGQLGEQKNGRQIRGTQHFGMTPDYLQLPKRHFRRARKGGVDLAHETNFPLSISLPYCAINYSPRNLLPRGCRIRLGGLKCGKMRQALGSPRRSPSIKCGVTLRKKIVDCEN